ncbi:hypothetical protein EE612_060614, partial [Oryza sativa]
EAGFPSPVG